MVDSSGASLYWRERGNTAGRLPSAGMPKSLRYFWALWSSVSETRVSALGTQARLPLNAASLFSTKSRFVGFWSYEIDARPSRVFSAFSAPPPSTSERERPYWPIVCSRPRRGVTDSAFGHHVHQATRLGATVEHRGRPLDHFDGIDVGHVERHAHAP